MGDASAVELLRSDCMELVESNDDFVTSHSPTLRTANPNVNDEKKQTGGSERFIGRKFSARGSRRSMGSTTSSDDFVNVEAPLLSAYGVPDNETAAALERCKKQVLTPYLRFLKVPGWRPLITVIQPAPWKKVVNIAYPVLVVFICLLGYVVQFAACYSRSNPSYKFQRVTHVNGNKSNVTDVVLCYEHSISSYAILDILHFGVYAYCFYLFRWAKTEQLQTLMEKTFLQCKSVKQRGYLSQGKLTASLRVSFWIGILWIVLSFMAQTLGVAGRAIEHERTKFGKIEFTWMGLESTSGQYALATFMLLAFVALDIVYVGVVVNYVTQCDLLIFLIRGITERVLEKTLSLEQAIKEYSSTGELIRRLNSELGIAVSLLEFLFGWLAVAAWLSLDSTKSSYAVLTASVMTVMLWTVMTLIPFVYAARLSNACGTIKKLGLEVRNRPFGYQNAAQDDLDSFLLFTSSFQPQAKLFRIPVYAPYLWGIVVTVCFVVLLLAQQGIISSGVF